MMLEEKEKARVLQKITYGVYIITSKIDDTYAAATVTWISQASKKPPLIMAGLKKDSTTYQTVVKAEKFTVHILNKFQKKMAAAFFKKTSVMGNKLNGYEFEMESNGSIVLKNVDAYFNCQLVKLIPGGDHDIILAEVKGVKFNKNSESLVLSQTGWKYGG